MNSSLSCCRRIQYMQTCQFDCLYLTSALIALPPLRRHTSRSYYLNLKCLVIPDYHCYYGYIHPVQAFNEIGSHKSSSARKSSTY